MPGRTLKSEKIGLRQRAKPQWLHSTREDLQLPRGRRAQGDFKVPYRGAFVVSHPD